MTLATYLDRLSRALSAAGFSVAPADDSGLIVTRADAPGWQERIVVTPPEVMIVSGEPVYFDDDDAENGHVELIVELQNRATLHALK